MIYFSTITSTLITLGAKDIASVEAKYVYPLHFMVSMSSTGSKLIKEFTVYMSRVKAIT